MHFIRMNGWLRRSLALLITLLDIDGIGKNWEDSDTMCRWVAVDFLGGARCNCTWDDMSALKSSEKRSDGHPDINPPRQPLALAFVHATFLSK